MENKKIETKLPALPFSIYFMKDGEVIPKRWFTVTENSLDKKEIYIAELKRWEAFDPDRIRVVGGFHLN